MHRDQHRHAIGATSLAKEEIGKVERERESSPLMEETMGTQLGIGSFHKTMGTHNKAWDPKRHVNKE